MLVRYSMQNSKKDNLPFRHGITLFKEQCLKIPQQVMNMKQIPYANVVAITCRSCCVEGLTYVMQLRLSVGINLI